MVKKYSIIILFCFLSHLTYAQVKIEKESRVVSNDVPEIAIKWLEDVFDHLFEKVKNLVLNLVRKELLKT